MNIMLNFMDKIYSDNKMLSIVYIVGACLLFIFIILLIFSLRKTDKKEPKIIEEPKIDDKANEIKEETIKEEANDTLENTEDVKEDKKETSLEDQNIFEKTTIIPLDQVKTDETLSKTENIEKALDNVENIKEVVPEIKEEKKEINISSEIPSVDDYVDNIVKKTYEKNEQFSSVYVDNENTKTMDLNQVMNEVNVDNDVKNTLTGDIQEVKEEHKEDTIDVDDIPSLKEETVEETKEEEINKTTSLDDLKSALESKQKENLNKQDDLKSKLDNLKKENESKETMKAEDLLNKLNKMKEE